MRFVLLRGVFALLIILPAPVANALSHTVSGSNGVGGPGCGTTPGFSNTSDTHATGGFSAQGGVCQSGASGFAGAGEMGLRVEYWSYPGNTGGNAQGSASSTYDISLTAPTGGWASGLISMSVVTRLAADLLVEIQTTSPFSRNSKPSSTRAST